MSRRTTRPFTIVPDDLIRSPDISSNELRLYQILLSYCAKSVGVEKKCSVPKRVLAAQMGLTITGTTNLLRQLEAKVLISVSYTTPQKPTYTVNTSPPETICPEEFKTRHWKKALAYIKESGGVKGLQKRTLTKSTKAPKRTGWGKSQSADADDPQDVPEPQVHQQPSLTDSTPQAGLVGCTPGNDPNPSSGLGDPIKRAWGPHQAGLGGFDQTHQAGLIPVQSKEESSLRVPYGTSAQADGCALARPEGVSRTALLMEPENLDPGAVRQIDIKNPEESSVPESEEQRIERLERQRKIKFGQLDFGFGPKAKSDGGSETKPKTKQRGAGPPPTGPGSGSGHRSTEDLRDDMTNDPKDVSAVPGDPWGLYTHFLKAVKAKYPKAQPSGHNKKILARGKQLLQDYNPVRVYEMIQVLVLDYESFATARVFLKFSGSAVPTFDQLCSNADLLSSFVGTGIISPPSVRRSPYAEDYARRKGKTTGGTVVEDSVDSIKALRDKYNRTIE